MDPTEVDDFLSLTGVKEQSVLLQYLADVLGMNNYVLMNIEDVWNNPGGMMREVAKFLEVPWTEKFLHWEVG